MAANPSFKIRGRYSDSNSSAEVEAKIRSKRLANLANGRIVDRELPPIQGHFTVSLAPSERLPPLSDSEIVQNFDQTKACRKTKNQLATRFYQARK